MLLFVCCWLYWCISWCNVETNYYCLLFYAAHTISSMHCWYGNGFCLKWVIINNQDTKKGNLSVQLQKKTNIITLQLHIHIHFKYLTQTVSQHHSREVKWNHHTFWWNVVGKKKYFTGWTFCHYFVFKAENENNITVQVMPSSCENGR